MTEAQEDLVTSVLANLGVGLILTGALGPAIVEAPLRFGLALVIGSSWLAGVAFISLAIYLKRD